MLNLMTNRFSRLLAMIILLASCARAQGPGTTTPEARLVGGPCEGCEAVLEYGDAASLCAVDTLYGFADGGRQVRISGTIYQPDGVTAAADVILYVYHTDPGGIYAPAPGATGWARRHGRRHAWLRTDARGRYTFYTVMPGHYPGTEMAAHIHPTILEPGGRYYYVADYLFADDPFLAEGNPDRERPRGGPGRVLTPRREGNLWVAERDLILGRHVPGYQ